MVLTINNGSSSLKCQLYDWEQGLALATGLVERVGKENSQLELQVYQQAPIKENKNCKNHLQALEWFTAAMRKSGCLKDEGQIEAIAHRVLHGGEVFRCSTLINQESLALFEKLIPLGPLHMPAALQGIKAAQNIFPHVTHTAVMDTAWHSTIPAEAYLYAVPFSWYQEHRIRRYGFHGTSYLYTAKRAAVLLGKDPFATNLIIAHMGSGSSICAVKNGVSIDTSMGFTPLEGLMMGTRSGDLDPAIVSYMSEQLQLPCQEITTLLNKKSGLLGFTGLEDRRDVSARANKGDTRCQQAVMIETRRLKKYIAAYTGLLGRVDALVFTAGVGEMSPFYRQRCVEGLEHIGYTLDEQSNQIAMTRNCETCVSKEHSAAKIFVIPTDEELVMSEDALAIQQDRYNIHTHFRYSFQNAAYQNKTREQALKKELQKNPRLAEIRALAPN